MALSTGSILGLGSAALGIGFGIGQKIQANSLEKKNKLPLTSVNQNIADNAAKAQQMAQVGIAGQQYNNAVNQNDQNLATVLASASRTGRNVNTAGILRQANIGSQNLNALDANARMQNQRYAAQQNQVLAQEQQRVWNWNFAQPYLRTAQQVASLRNAGNQNIFGGIGTVAQMGIGGAFDGTKSTTGGVAGFGTPRGTYGGY